MAYHVELAKAFKDRENESNIGAVIGQVVSVNPIKISIYDGAIILGEDDLYITETFKSKAEVGINALIIAQENNQIFFAIDKLV